MTGLGDSYLDAIRGFEGFNPRPYWDYRQWTSGYGTRASGPGEVIDRAEADRRLQAELNRSLGSVRGLGVPMTPGQEAALTSLTYNAGPGWINSGLGAAVRAGDWRTARQRFLQYINAGGQPLPGLQSRRAIEAGWLDSGGPQTPPAPLGAPPSPITGGAPSDTSQSWLQMLGSGLGGIVGIPSARAETPPPPITIPQSIFRGVDTDITPPLPDAGIQGGPPVAGRLPAPVTPPPVPAPGLMPPAPTLGSQPPPGPVTSPPVMPSPTGPSPDVLAGGAGTGLLPQGTVRSLLGQFVPAPTVPPFGAPTVTPELGTVNGPFGQSEVQPMGRDVVPSLGPLPPQAPPPVDADAIVAGAQRAADERAQAEAQRPGILQGLMQNPAFLAGLSILGTAPGGNWGPNAAAAATQAMTNQRQQTEYERLQSRRATMDRIWREAFPGGQASMSHPLLQGIPPEMAQTIFAMGPEEGLPALNRFQMLRGQQQLTLQTAADRMRLALEQYGIGSPQAPPSGGSQVEQLRAMQDRLSTGTPFQIPQDTTGLSAPPSTTTAPPVQPPPGSGVSVAPTGRGIPGSEPTVRVGNITMPLSQARAVADARAAAGIRSQVLEQAISAAERESQAPSGYRYNASGNLEPIPGGPGSRLQGSEAAQLALLQTARGQFAQARQFFERGWGAGEFGSALMNAGDYNRHARTIGIAVEAALRAMSGQAVPESEVVRYQNMFLPAMNDSRATAQQKLSLLQDYMDRVERYIQSGRIGTPPQPGGGGDGWSITRVQ